MPVDLEWLRAELEKPGRTQSDCARYIGLGSPSQINRVLKGIRQLKDYEAEKIRQYLAETDLAVFGQPAKLPQSAQLEPHAPVGVKLINVVGTVEAGAWREVSTDHTLESVPVMDSRAFEGDDVFALRVAGNSMNQRYPEGATVICRAWRGGALPVGKDVVVERVDATGKVETTLKELVATATGFQLRPRSNDPRYQEPLRFDPADEALVRLIGRVIWKMEPVD